MNFIVFVLSAAFASMIVPEFQGLEMGQSCDSNNPSFKVTSFTLTPWPAQPGSVVSFAMTGTFTIAERVSQLKIGSNFDNTQWDYIDWDIDIAFTAGQSHTFSYGLQIGSISGTYQNIFELDIGTTVPISCWSISYII